MRFEKLIAVLKRTPPGREMASVGKRQESLSRDGDKKTGPAPFIFLARFRIWMTTCAPPVDGFLSVTHSLTTNFGH